jgi:hypothetical protein
VHHTRYASQDASIHAAAAQGVTVGVMAISSGVVFKDQIKAATGIDLDGAWKTQ